MNNYNEDDPQVLLYPEGSRAKRTVERAAIIGLLGLSATALAVALCFWKDWWYLLFISIGIWAVVPPLWFAYEYFFIYRRFGLPGTFEIFKHGQQVSGAIWAGILAALITLASSDFVKSGSSAGQCCKSQMSEHHFTGTAFVWVPVACANRVKEIESLRSAGEKENVRESWTRFSEAVRSARPGSSVYAPKPYPQSRADILEDFEYAFRSTLVGNTAASELPEGVADVYRALERGTLDIEILRVENWGLSRCGSGKLKPFSHLLRLRNRDSGREIGRITVHDSGLWGQFRPIPEGAEGHASLTIPPLADFQGFLSRQFGFRQPVQQVQYVAADGLSHCSPVVPCVAFQAQGKVYLVDAGRLLYEVRLADGLVSVTEHRSRARGPRTLAPDLEAPLVSVGFAWAQARRVAGQLGER